MASGAAAGGTKFMAELAKDGQLEEMITKALNLRSKYKVRQHRSSFSSQVMMEFPSIIIGLLILRKSDQGLHIYSANKSLFEDKVLY